MKRLIKLLLIFVFFFSFSLKTEAKTLKDLKNSMNEVTEFNKKRDEFNSQIRKNKQELAS